MALDRILGLFGLVVGVMASGPVGGCAHRAADLVLMGGRIYTVDDDRPVVEAVAVKGDRILETGSDEEIASHIGPGTEVVDLQGLPAYPGFIEGHGHFLGLGMSLLRLDLRGVRSFEEMVSLVAARVKTAAAGAWIVGRGWHQETWDAPPEPAVEGLPVHTRLSEVAPDNPVLLVHASGHAAIANARAMERAGITETTPDPPGGQMIRDDCGKLTGVFREAAEELLWDSYTTDQDARPAGIVEAERRKAVALATRECLRAGVTSFQDAGSPFEVIDLYRKLAEEGSLGIRLWVMILAEDNNELRQRMLHYRIRDLGKHRLTVRAVKQIADGALGSHGAWLLAPYTDKPESTGLNVTAPAVLRRTARLAARYGFQLCVHAIGDRANREVLDIYQETFEAHPDKRDLRWRIEHAQHLHPDDIPRFAGLGVIASMQGVHCTSDGPWVEKRLGEQRAREGAYAWRKLLDTGAVISNGTDTPVEPVDAIAGFRALVTRRLSGGTRFYPEQCLTREEALRAMTLQPAYAAFEEDLKGSLVPGKLADLVILSADLMEVPESEIRDTEVLATVLGGAFAYRNPTLEDYERLSDRLAPHRSCAGAEVEAALDSLEQSRELNLRGRMREARDALRLAYVLADRAAWRCRPERAVATIYGRTWPGAEDRPPHAATAGDDRPDHAPVEGLAGHGGQDPPAGKAGSEQCTGRDPGDLSPGNGITNPEEDITTTKTGDEGAGGPDPRRDLVIAQLRIAEEHAGRGEDDRAREAYRRTVEAWKRNGLPPGGPAAEAAARAQFKLTELDLPEFERLRIEGEAGALQESMEAKARRLRELEKAYRAVFACRAADWTVAAAFRLGYLYENFADTLEAVPCPGRLPADACDLFKEQIQELSLPVIQKAVQAYRAAEARAAELDAGPAWAARARQRLQLLAPRLQKD